MKKKLGIFALVFCLALTFGGCEEKNKDKTSEKKAESSASETETGKAVDYDKVYDNLLEEYYYTIEYASNQSDIKEGFMGVVEVGSYLEDEALDVIGYKIEDINGDGIKELLIGQSYDEEYAYVKNDLYAMYTLVIDSPTLVLEGRSRNSYSLMDKGEIYNGGSNGASYRIFGTYSLGEEGNLVCSDFNFSYERSNDYTDIGFFHNTTGEYDKNKAEEMQISEEEFGEMENSLGKRTIAIDFTPFRNFTPKGDGEEIFNADTTGDPVLWTVNGNWDCLMRDEDGQQWMLSLDLYSDGSGSYRCGPYESEYIVHFRGKWARGSEKTRITLDMEDSYGSGPFNGEFMWNVKNDTLTLVHTDGDPFLYGTEGKPLEFTKRK